MPSLQLSYPTPPPTHACRRDTCPGHQCLGINAWAMARWIAGHGWPVNPTLSFSDGRIDHLLGLAAFSVVVLI